MNLKSLASNTSGNIIELNPGLSGLDGFTHLLRGMAEHMEPTRIRVPLSILHRDLGATVAASGGYFVGRKTAPLEDILRGFNPVFEAGCRVITGVTGTADFPIVKTGAAAAWLATEGATISGTADPTLGLASGSPKHAAAWLPYSRQVFMASSWTAEVVQQQLLGAVADLLGAAAIGGSAAAGQPAGLAAISGVNSVSGSSFDHADALAMRKACISAGARESSLMWIGAPDVQELLGGRERSAGGGRFLWDDGEILGRPAQATASCPDDMLVVGPWDQVIVLIWGDSFVVEFDPSTGFRYGKVLARILLECDVLCLRPGAFCLSSSIT